jgi:hypothetical protein
VYDYEAWYKEAGYDSVLACAGYLGHPFLENDRFCERMSQAGCLCEAEKRMKVSSTPTLIGRGNEGKTHVKADAEQGNGPES